MEIIGHEGRGGRGRAKGREQQAERPPPQMLFQRREGQARAILDGPSTQRIVFLAVQHHGAHAGFIDGDERRHSCEGQLEARAHDRFRLDQNDERGGDGEVAHGQRLPVEEDRRQHDYSHEQRAFGANPRSRREIVKNGARDGESRRPFLDRIGERQRLAQSQDPPQADKKNRCDKRHLDAGNCDDMKNPGLADDLLGFAGEKIALAGDHRCGNGSRIAANDRIDAARQRIAAAIDRHHHGGPKARRHGRRDNLDAAQDIADSAELREPSVSCKIIAAGQARAGRRQQPRLEVDKGAGLERRCPPRREPDADGRLIGCEAARRLYTQEKAGAGAAVIHFFDKTVERRDMDLIDDRRGDSRGPQCRRQFAREERAEAAKEEEGEPVRLREIGEDAEGHGGAFDEKKRGFAVSVKVEDGPCPGRNRQPQKRAPERRLRLKSLFEKPDKNCEFGAKFFRKARHPAEAPPRNCCFRHSRHWSMLDWFF